MNSAILVECDVEGSGPVDVVEEMRLRTWARKNYAREQERNEKLHPIVREEMARMDRENRPE